MRGDEIPRSCFAYVIITVHGMIRRVIGIHFSPIGGTARMTQMLTEQLAEILRADSPVEIETETYELLGMKQSSVELDDETVAVIGMPVYVGKVPLPAVSLLSRFKPNGAVAVDAVSFGARSYGNALYELQHYTENLGFKVVGAGAFSVSNKKSGFGNTPTGHTGDIESLRNFGAAAASKIRRLAGSDIEGLRVKPAPLEVAGRLPIHRISRISPRAAAMAQDVLEMICVRRRKSEWYL